MIVKVRVFLLELINKIFDIGIVLNFYFFLRCFVICFMNGIEVKNIYFNYLDIYLFIGIDRLN